MAKKEKNREIVIKRYGNRRLYNTETSTHLSLQELAGLIRAGRDVKVIDSKSKEDITKQILTQIIFEEGDNPLPVPFLHQIIRLQNDGGSIQDFLQNYLAASFEAYMKAKNEFDKQFRNWLEISPPQIWEKIFPLNIWKLEQDSKREDTEDEEN
ncbi:MAG: transcriptional regulator [Blastocatellia bacterium]|nr:transcriptional regulator [Blastocatellia bacterium]